ncbi:MAG: cbb3-type cytochrome oxidase assembly protein CcoS [Parvularculaceae bacterium]|nr:cbb3-type cytochrome oxidase assembly protein CcoS [Parvularculaceae bacterium]
MSVIAFLIPIAIALGGAGLAAFFWALRSGQYEDLEGASRRILIDDDAGPL